MPKRKAAPFVPTLSPDSDAKRDWMCLARMTASAVVQFLGLTWNHLNMLFLCVLPAEMTPCEASVQIFWRKQPNETADPNLTPRAPKKCL